MPLGKVVCSLLLVVAVSACGAPAEVAGPSSVSPEVVVIRNPQKVVHDPPYVPEWLDVAGQADVFPAHVERAFERWRRLTGETGVPPRLFDRVVAAADYVANLAKHPHRHEMGREISDPRAWDHHGAPEVLARLAEENQQWNGVSWVPAPGLSIEDAVPLECSFQHLILGGLVNALGAQWMLLTIEGHTAFTYYDYELGKWVYVESTFNEHYRAPGSDPEAYVPMSPGELRAFSVEGRLDEVVAVRHPYQPQRVPPDSPYYVRSYAERQPDGFASMAVSLLGTSVTEKTPAYGIRVLPGGRSESYFRDLITRGWPVDDDPAGLWAGQGETFLDSVSVTGDDRAIFFLSTNLAVSDYVFEVSRDEGRTWRTAHAAFAARMSGPGRLRFRARNGTVVTGQVVVAFARARSSADRRGVATWGDRSTRSEGR